jgi:hypothetical protein
MEKTIKEKRKIVIEDMVNWFRTNASQEEVMYIFREGWAGVNHMTDEEVEAIYKKIMEDI